MYISTYFVDAKNVKFEIDIADAMSSCHFLFCTCLQLLPQAQHETLTGRVDEQAWSKDLLASPPPSSLQPIVDVSTMASSPLVKISVPTPRSLWWN